MAYTSTVRTVNPRLGAYYGIFMSLFAAMALLTLILEGLGIASQYLSLAMLLVPLMLYVAIGVATHTGEAVDFFAAGRRVPAFFNGLALSMSAFGATGFVVLTGMFFLIGFDALFIAIGALAGFVIMAIMLAPFLRKFGTFTIPSYLGRRFDSRVLRMTAAVLLSVPILMVLIAELKLAAEAAIWLSGWPAGQCILILTLSLLATLLPGGMRSSTWTGVAQGLAAMIAIIATVAIVAVIVTNFPLPQLTHGPVLRAVSRHEAMQGLPIILPPLLAFDIPEPGLQPVVKRFADAFGAVGSLAFVLSMLTTMAGVASAPWLLPRLAAAPGVYEARKTLGWATFLFGIAMLTSAAAAVFMRDYLMDLIVTPGPAIVPPWLADLAKRGLASITESGTRFQVSSINFARDGVLFSLPVAAQLPAMVLNLTLAGAAAAGLAAATASATAFGHILSEDLFYGRTWEPPHGGIRLHAGRIGIALAVLAGGTGAMLLSADPLRLVLYALALGGSALFPVLVLSIWWKRMNAYGALAGIVTGYAIAAIAIVGSHLGVLGVDGALAAVFGLPASAAAAMAVALVTPVPDRHVLELVRDIRVPGGEILYDREMRMQRLKRQRQLG